MIMRKLVLLLALAATLAVAAGVRDDFKQDIRRSANNYYAYPDGDLPALTPAPAGYEPFFLNHYGRHGSRWLIGKKLYNFPVEQLEIGERNGKLTARGKEVLAILRELRESARGRDGELSDIGAEQHQGIARRMMANFPQVFAGDAPVRARSTVVIRCLLSMQNEVDVLKSLNPQLRITTDASEAEISRRATAEMRRNDSFMCGLLRRSAGQRGRTYLHRPRGEPGNLRAFPERRC